MKIPTPELYLKEATVIYGFYLLTARQIARTCPTPNAGASFELSDEYGIVEVQVVEMTEAAATKPGSVTTLHVSVV